MENNYNFIYPGTNISLQQVQDVEYEILVEFDRVCKILNTPYQLFAGTLLGAVRHKDFIPWDDDIDVCMLRSDYEHFVNECGAVLCDKFFLQTSKTDPKSVVQFAKIRKNGTVYENDVDNLPDSHTGIWIDIFPMDKVKPGTISEKVQYFEVSVLYALITSTVKNRVLASRTLWKRLIRGFFHFVMHIVSKTFVERQLYKVMTRYENTDAKHLAMYSNGVGWNYYGHIRELESFYDTISMKFHEAEFLVPRNYDEVLTKAYGDYMKFPPEEERKPKHGVVKVKIEE